MGVVRHYYVVMAHHTHPAPLVVLKKSKKINKKIFVTNGAPCLGAPLLVLSSNGALSTGAPLLSFFQKKFKKNFNFFLFFFKTSNGAPWWRTTPRCAITNLPQHRMHPPPVDRLFSFLKNKRK